MKSAIYIPSSLIRSVSMNNMSLTVSSVSYAPLPPLGHFNFLLDLMVGGGGGVGWGGMAFTLKIV